MPLFSQEWENVGLAGIDEYDWFPGYLHIDMDVDTPYIAYQSHNGIDSAVVRKWNGLDWEKLPDPNGLTGYDVVNCVEFKIVDGIPYVGYMEYGSGDDQLNGSILKWENGAWQAVGGVNIFTTDVPWFKFDVFGGKPTVVFPDIANARKLSVIAFDGNSWGYVGDTVISDNPVSGKSVDIAVDKSGVPYVVYREQAAWPKGICKRWNGTTWEFAGNNGNGFSVAEIEKPDIEFCAFGIPYIFFGDYGYGGSGGVSRTAKASVKKLVDNNWEPVGQQPIDQRIASSRICSKGGNPVVFYKKYESDSFFLPAIVKEFINGQWVQIGGDNAGSNSTYPEVLHSDVAVSASGQYYTTMFGLAFPQGGDWLEVTTFNPVCDDPDRDGVCSSIDNCPLMSNPDQGDDDNDGIGNVCDPDYQTCIQDGVYSGVIASKTYRTSRSITSDGTIPEGAAVSFLSGEIELTASFSIEAGAELFVGIDPCVSTIIVDVPEYKTEENPKGKAVKPED